MLHLFYLWFPTNPTLIASSGETWVSCDSTLAFLHFSVFTLRFLFVCVCVFPRRSLDAAHLARVPAHLLHAEPPAADPGSAQRLQLHPGGRVHWGADHTRPAAHVPDPANQQGRRGLPFTAANRLFRLQTQDKLTCWEYKLNLLASSFAWCFSGLTGGNQRV